MKDLSELTTHCIRCGFCLEACPTFTTTASEMESPRGRIYLVRSAMEGKLRWQEDVKEHLDRCLGCRACETACPSGVEYGAILELARDKIEQERGSLAKTALLEVTTRPGVLKTQLALGKLWPGKRVPGFVSWLVSGASAEAEKPVAQSAPHFPPLDATTLPAIKGEVYMLEGCAMRVLYPRVHEATRRLLRRVGYLVKPADQGCCGALHAHNGHLDEAKSLASKLIEAMPGDFPVIVNSAGCGSTMKEYGHLVGGAKAESYAARVKDISEFLLAEGLIDVLKGATGFSNRTTYHDACHLAHGQRIWTAPRDLVQAIPQIAYVELPEADTCCGSAGIYNVTQPALARQLVERKFGHIQSTGAVLVATGNPGCHAWIAQAAREHGGQVKILHTMEFLEAAFIGLEYFS